MNQTCIFKKLEQERDKKSSQQRAEIMRQKNKRKSVTVPPQFF